MNLSFSKFYSFAPSKGGDIVQFFNLFLEYQNLRSLTQANICILLRPALLDYGGQVALTLRQGAPTGKHEIERESLIVKFES